MRNGSDHSRWKGTEDARPAVAPYPETGKRHSKSGKRGCARREHGKPDEDTVENSGYPVANNSQKNGERDGKATEGE